MKKDESKGYLLNTLINVLLVYLRFVLLSFKSIREYNLVGVNNIGFTLTCPFSMNSK